MDGPNSRRNPGWIWRWAPPFAPIRAPRPPLPMSPIEGNYAAAHSCSPPFDGSASIYRLMLHPVRVRLKGPMATPGDSRAYQLGRGTTGNRVRGAPWTERPQATSDTAIGQNRQRCGRDDYGNRA